MPSRHEPNLSPFAHPRRVLIVEDSHDSAELLRMVMSLAGHETRVAYSAAQALATVKEFLPEVAFIDIALPGMDGIDLAHALRALPQLGECRLIAVTGCILPPDRRPRPPLFNALLLKPLSIRTLQSTVLALDHFEMNSVRD